MPGAICDHDEVKAAYHFNAEYSSLGSWYGPKLEESLFTALLERRTLPISSKIYVGDLPLAMIAHDPDALERVLARWASQSESVWRRFTSRIPQIAESRTFVICLESISRDVADFLHDKLSHHEYYLGAVEVDDASKVHWSLYSDCLRLQYRIHDNAISIFYDELQDDSPTDNERDQATKRFLTIGFSSVSFETCSGHHSLFDKYHNFKHARRIAEWRSRCSDLLGHLVDEVTCRLNDAVPELGNKLWAALNTYDNAETDEQYAQVSATCRRIVKYVADHLFPASDETREGRKLGESHYRNRLLAWVEDQTDSRTTIELIAGSLELFAQHVEKLQNLANKGIHAEIQRGGARKCLLRTVLLLDDIVSLCPAKFPVNPELDLTILTGSDEPGHGG
ncbi:MAG TPA: hypothetical protein PLI29_16825 [Verrucomicrobiota bacterium]|nr:hypothetical protein [Verrucomicrobiota bacterium]